MKFMMVPLAFIFSFSALSKVSLQTKVKKVQELKDLVTNTPSISFDAYERELYYEELGLSVEQRARREANLIAEKVRLHVQRAYQIASEELLSNEAYDLVKSKINNDLSLISADLQSEIQAVALGALNDAALGVSNDFSEYPQLENALVPDIKERVNYLNQETTPPPSNGTSIDFEKKNYQSKAELVDSLVSKGENSDWVSTSSIRIDSDQVSQTDTRIKLRIRADFMGVSIEAGPIIIFKRTFKTNFTIMADGLYPVLNSDGGFNFFQRDKEGNVVVKNGEKQQRYIFFSCHATLDFSTDYSGGGGFSILGAGESSNYSKSFNHSVNTSSRRVFLPQSVGGVSVTLNFLNEICHEDFLHAKIFNNMTVSDSLNIMMKNVTSNLHFSHPKTRCVRDDQCYNWFLKSIFNQNKSQLFPRCLENRSEKFKSCFALGLAGANCTVIENGKRTSSGMFEVHCDKGLKCQKYQDAYFLGKWRVSNSKGRCVPKNAQSYVKPQLMLLDITN